MINHPNRSKKNNAGEVAVVVTTQHRGVFFGYTQDYSGESVTLRAGRNCLSWSSDVKGFMGLGATGPSKNCRIGPAVDILLHNVTSAMKCKPEAIAAWEAAPWSR